MRRWKSNDNHEDYFNLPAETPDENQTLSHDDLKPRHKRDCEQDKWFAAHGQSMERSVKYPVTNVIG